MIDLSKAYKGQTATFADGQSSEIERIKYYPETTLCKAHVVIRFTDSRAMSYSVTGTRLSDFKPNDIVSLSDPTQVQVARLEGEIKGVTETLKSVAYAEWQEIDNRKAALIEQLKALQDENS